MIPGTNTYNRPLDTGVHLRFVEVMTASLPLEQARGRRVRARAAVHRSRLGASLSPRSSITAQGPRYLAVAGSGNRA